MARKKTGKKMVVCGCGSGGERRQGGCLRGRASAADQDEPPHPSVRIIAPDGPVVGEEAAAEVVNERVATTFRTNDVSHEDGYDNCELRDGCPWCGNCIIWDDDEPPRAGKQAYCIKDDCNAQFIFE